MPDDLFQLDMPQPPVMPADHKVEPDFAEPYFRWQQQPNPRTAGALLGSLRPVLAAGARAAGDTGPLGLSRARRMALDSLPKYDAAKGPLRPFLQSQLRGLLRQNQQSQQILQVPERVLLAKRTIMQAEADLRDELGRDPADTEVADRSGLSLARIKQVRSFRPGFSESQISAMSADPENPIEPEIGSPEMRQRQASAIVGFVYDGLDDPLDRAVMEYTLGLHGSPKLATNEIARRLNRSPAAISQRASRLTAQLQELADAKLL